MELIIALFVTSWIALSAIKLKFSLHMIQIEGYDSYKYLEWVSTHKDKVYTDYDKIYLIISLINSMVFLIVNKATNNSLLIFSVSPGNRHHLENVFIRRFIDALIRG